MENKIEKLREVLKVQSYSYEQWRMFAYIIRKVYDYDFYVNDGNIYIEKGEAKNKPCIVAHMDTVHPIAEDLSILEVDGKLTGFNRVNMTQTGIGGDDKVGIFIALQCLEYFDNIKVAFFRDEEVGCVGSGNADMAFFDNCTFVLQCDRKGNKDFVTNASGTELSSKEWQNSIKNTINKYGYSYANGMMTDVMTLKENGLKVCCANISCGYYNPHCDNEYVVIADVMNCLSLVIDVIEKYGTKVYKHKYTFMSKYKTNYGKKYKWWDVDNNGKHDVGYKYSFDIENKATGECLCCGVYSKLIYDNYFDSHLCEDCMTIYAK